MFFSRCVICFGSHNSLIGSLSIFILVVPSLFSLSFHLAFSAFFCLFCFFFRASTHYAGRGEWYGLCEHARSRISSSLSVCTVSLRMCMFFVLCLCLYVWYGMYTILFLSNLLSRIPPRCADVISVVRSISTVTTSPPSLFAFSIASFVLLSFTTTCLCVGIFNPLFVMCLVFFLLVGCCCVLRRAVFCVVLNAGCTLVELKATRYSIFVFFSFFALSASSNSTAYSFFLCRLSSTHHFFSFFIPALLSVSTVECGHAPPLIHSLDLSVHLLLLFFFVSTLSFQN